MLHATLLQLCFHFNVQDVVVITKSGVWALRSQAQEPVAWTQWSATQASSVVGRLVQSSRLIGLTFTPLQGSPPQLALLGQLQTSHYSNHFPNHFMPTECLSLKSRKFKSNHKATKSNPKPTHTLKPSKRR